MVSGIRNFMIRSKKYTQIYVLIELSPKLSRVYTGTL